MDLPRVDFAVTITSLKAAIEMLQSPRLHQLLAFRSSESALDRAVSVLSQKKAAIEKFEATVSESSKKCNELSLQLQQLAQQSALIVKNCKQMQKQLEEEMSSLFPGFSVRIIGEINTL